MWFLSEWDQRCCFHSVPVKSRRGLSHTWKSIGELETWCLGPGCKGLQGDSIGHSWWLVLGSWREAWLLGDVGNGKGKVCCEERKSKRKGLNRMLTSQRESEIKIGLGPCESDGQFSPLRFPSSHLHSLRFHNSPHGPIWMELGVWFPLWLVVGVWASSVVIYNCEESVLVHIDDNEGICICDEIHKSVLDWSHKVYKVCSAGMGISLLVVPGRKLLGDEQ